MDKWLTLIQAANRLNINEHDLLDLASDNRINMYWYPNKAEGIEVIKVELVKTTDLDDVECKKWLRVKGSSVIQHNFGPFLIDVLIDNRWTMILRAIKNGGTAGDVIQLHDDSMIFKDSQGHVYAVYFDDPHDYVLPKLNELRVISSELYRYKNQVKSTKDLPEKNGINKQRTRAYKKYLDETNQWHRLNEKSPRGKKGFKYEVFEALKYEKANDGTDLFADKAVMKVSWENLKSTHKNKI